MGSELNYETLGGDAGSGNDLGIYEGKPLCCLSRL